MEKFLAKCREAWEQKAVVEKLKDELKEANGEFTRLKNEIEKAMEASELEKQHIPGYGTISRVQKLSVKVPATPDEKKALFDWIQSTKGADVLFSLQSINSKTLNAMYKEEMDNAIKEGNTKFHMPGIQPPKAYYEIGMKKG